MSKRNHAFVWDGPEMYCARCGRGARDAIGRPCGTDNDSVTVEPEPKISKGDVP